MSEEDGGGGEGGEEEQEVGGRDPHVQCRHCKNLNIKMWKKSRFKVSFVSFFCRFFSKFYSDRFDTSGSMILLLVPEISPYDGFCDEEQQEQELGILVVGF